MVKDCRLKVELVDEDTVGAELFCICGGEHYEASLRHSGEDAVDVFTDFSIVALREYYGLWDVYMGSSVMIIEFNCSKVGDVKGKFSGGVMGAFINALFMEAGL